MPTRVRTYAPASQEVSILKQLERPLRPADVSKRCRVRSDEVGGHVLHVELEFDASGFRLGWRPFDSCIVEDGDSGIVIVEPRIVLIVEIASFAHGKIAMVAALLVSRSYKQA